jgi:hypothetical protein
MSRKPNTTTIEPSAIVAPGTSQVTNIEYLNTEGNVVPPPVFPIVAPILPVTTAQNPHTSDEPTPDVETTTEPDTRRNKGRGTGTSEKSRAAMGLSDDQTTIWIPCILLKTTRDLLAKCAKHRNVKLTVFAATFAAQGIESNMAALTAEAAEYDNLRAIAEGPRTPKKLSTMTPEQLRAFVAQQKQLQAQAQAMLDALNIQEKSDIE